MKCDNIELLRENIHKKDLQLLHGIALGVCRKFGKAMEELEIDEKGVSELEYRKFSTINRTHVLWNNNR